MEFLRELRHFFNLTQDEFARKIKLEDRTMLAQYEVKITPPLKVLNNISESFGISIDYIVLNNNCTYPRNLKLLALAKSFDNTAQSQIRSHVETSALIFLKNDFTAEIKQDSLDLDLTNDFHSNLKSIRSFKGISQSELANSLGIGRTAVTLLENKNFPTLDNFQKLSECLDISMHALFTGQKLHFEFTDGHFGKIMLLADRFLSLDKQKNLIDLMESILQK